MIEHKNDPNESIRQDIRTAESSVRGGTSGGKGLVSLLLKMLLASLAFLIPVMISVIAVNFFPGYVLGGGYGRLKAQVDHAENAHEYNRVLIIGDSLAQASYLPSALGEDTYNYGMGQETPVDGYFRLLYYLDNHPKPEYIFCSYCPFEFVSQAVIWRTPILLHVMPFDMAKKIMSDAENYDEDSGLKQYDSDFLLLTGCIGAHPDSIKTIFKGLFNNLLGNSGYESFQINYNVTTENRGHWQHCLDDEHGTDANMDTVNALARSFSVTEMADAYMKKIASLCRALDIGFIVETVPFNEATYSAVDPAIMGAYKAYWDGFQEKFPEVRVNGEISYYDNSYFGDSLHLNAEGTQKYSQYIREKYAYIFEESEA